MLQQKASGGLSTINYIPFIESLNAFASAAGIKEGPEGTRFQRCVKAFDSWSR